MKIVECNRCGSAELTPIDGYVVCDFCQSRFVLHADELPAKETNIELHSDVEVLLRKCREDPTNRIRYAGLVLDIDPLNQEALRFLN
jgi:uncharacterized Zn finger protein (UPF0148 family)